LAASDKEMLGLVNRFDVTVTGGPDLGSWSRVEGLDVTFDAAEYRAGDHGNHRWFYPGNTKYTNVKFSRGANKKDTPNVQSWLSEVAKKFKLGEIKVTLRDAHHEAVSDWSLKDAYPIKWSINGFDSGGGTVAIETLEIIHNGFLDDEQAS
jgi:phage tail-like protein